MNKKRRLRSSKNKKKGIHLTEPKKKKVYMHEVTEITIAATMSLFAWSGPMFTWTECEHREFPDAC